MNMIPIPPSENHLSRLYYELGKVGARSAGSLEDWPCQPESLEELVVIAAEWSRWDPRLMEILVNFSLDHWEKFSPQEIRRLQKKMKTPQALGVLSAFLFSASPQNRELALFWHYVVADLEKVKSQFYFRDLYQSGSLLASVAVKETLLEFADWGFLARERIFIEKTGKRVGHWDQSARLHILRRLFGRRNQLTLSDYLNEVESGISRQQAMLDFKKLGAILRGKGRGAFWEYASLA